MARKKVLFICGSLNQTTIMHQISNNLPEDYESWFSPFYGDGYIEFFRKKGMLDFSILGGTFFANTMKYLNDKGLNVDYQGKKNTYDLVYTGSDLIVPKNIENAKLVLVQEGMTDPENFAYLLVRYLGAPRWMASTASTGLSHKYDSFCVASEGYKKLFMKKGVPEEKMIVTGIPNFDNCARFLDNDFPHKDYVMVATSDARETFKIENRKKFILDSVKKADGRQLLFKFHPNENFDRATREVEQYAPGSLIYTSGNTDHMIANCSTLITKYSSVVYVGLALGKEVYSWFDLEELISLTPVQNGGTSGKNIAEVGVSLVEDSVPDMFRLQENFSLETVKF